MLSHRTCVLFRVLFRLPNTGAVCHFPLNSLSHVVNNQGACRSKIYKKKCTSEHVAKKVAKVESADNVKKVRTVEETLMDVVNHERDLAKVKASSEKDHLAKRMNDLKRSLLEVKGTFFMYRLLYFFH